jgi:hypothetical protein
MFKASPRKPPAGIPEPRPSRGPPNCTGDFLSFSHVISEEGNFKQFLGRTKRAATAMPLDPLKTGNPISSLRQGRAFGAWPRPRGCGPVARNSRNFAVRGRAQTFVIIISRWARHLKIKAAGHSAGSRNSRHTKNFFLYFFGAALNHGKSSRPPCPGRRTFLSPLASWARTKAA